MISTTPPPAQTSQKSAASEMSHAPARSRVGFSGKRTVRYKDRGVVGVIRSQSGSTPASIHSDRKPHRFENRIVRPIARYVPKSCLEARIDLPPTRAGNHASARDFFG